jgi:hypothetical protein
MKIEGWTIATMIISLSLAGSTITELKHNFEKHKRHEKGMSVIYLWLRSVLFSALVFVLFINPNRNAETMILGGLSVWYVIFYGILLVLHYTGSQQIKNIEAP